jgi:ribonucleoside-diphosphate reductase alpha chain
LGIPYNSEEGFAFMSRVAEFFAYHSTRASVDLAKERGPFPLFRDSSYKDGKLAFDGFYHREWQTMEGWDELGELVRSSGIRNSHTLTIAPTGSISMIADTSSGLEPQFALVFEKHVTVGSFFYTDPELERQLAEAGLMEERTLKKIANNGGSLVGIEDEILGRHAKGKVEEASACREIIPTTAAAATATEEEEEKLVVATTTTKHQEKDVDRLGEVFLVAYDIPWWDHIRAQYEMQKWISASVSKTINMPSWVTIEDVEKAYLFAYRLGLKGVTIYRDGSKDEQVLRTPSQRLERYIAPAENRTISMMKELGIEPPPRGEEKISAVATHAPAPSPVQPAASHDDVGIVKQASGLAPLVVESRGASPPKCPVCGGMNIVSQEGCRKCLDCGWSTCTVA